MRNIGEVSGALVPLHHLAQLTRRLSMSRWCGSTMWKSTVLVLIGKFEAERWLSHKAGSYGLPSSHLEYIFVNRGSSVCHRRGFRPTIR